MSRFMSRVALAACAFSISMPSVEGNVFLGRELPRLRMDDHLLEDLEEVLGQGHREKAAKSAAVIEEGLRPIFQALPRNNEDLLEPTAVRYLLHRYFVDRHGWFVVGFDTAGEAWDASSATSVFAEHADGAQNVFDKRMSRGMSLREVALLGATLESLVHAETVQRLHAAYSVLGLAQVEDHPSEANATLALDVYMLLYLFGEDPNTVTQKMLDKLFNLVADYYPNWAETKKWAHQVRREVLASSPQDRTSFEASVRVVEAIADRYGRWQDKECIELKDSLVKLERPGTGRVPLSNFYKAALNGAWQFTESSAYLRHLGALDETDENRPSVMISNYVNSPANCVSSSKFYTVCCINECESLLGHIEKKLAAPSATVQRIVEVVQNLPSATEDAPRVLPERLVSRLQEIADHHGGLVPFHARLFNQWLHHAYPRECPYPHLAGEISPLQPAVYTSQMGVSDWVEVAEMEAYVQRGMDEKAAGDGSVPELPWSVHEEHFIPQVKPQSRQSEASSAFSSMRGVMFCILCVSVGVTLFRMTSSQAKGALSVTTQKDLFV